MIEFVADKPFDDELGAEGLELLGEETVGEEACYQIHVKYGGGQGESTWFFSKKDLPAAAACPELSISRAWARE